MTVLSQMVPQVLRGLTAAIFFAIALAALLVFATVSVLVARPAQALYRAVTRR